MHAEKAACGEEIESAALLEACRDGYRRGVEAVFASGREGGARSRARARANAQKGPPHRRKGRQRKAQPLPRRPGRSDGRSGQKQKQQQQQDQQKQQQQAQQKQQQEDEQNQNQKEQKQKQKQEQEQEQEQEQQEGEEEEEEGPLTPVMNLHRLGLQMATAPASGGGNPMAEAAEMWGHAVVLSEDLIAQEQQQGIYEEEGVEKVEARRDGRPRMSMLATRARHWLQHSLYHKGMVRNGNILRNGNGLDISLGTLTSHLSPLLISHWGHSPLTSHLS